MTARLTAAKAPQARSGHERRSLRDAVAGMANRFDDVVTQLGPEAADAHVDDVRARVEAVAPHLVEEAGAAADLARVREQVLEDEELARRQRDRAVAEIRRPAMRVEGEPAGVDQARLLADVAVAQARPHP